MPTPSLENTTALAARGAPDANQSAIMSSVAKRAAHDELERGREAYATRTWRDAHELLSLADAATPLGGEDLELLATSAYMLGRDDDYVRALERAHQAYLDGGETLRAARCAFWIGMNLAMRGEAGQASGWFGRAQRLIDRVGRECVEHGYLLLPLALQNEAGGDYEGAAAAAADAAEIGERFEEADLFALAVHEQGNALVKHGRIAEGVRLLDEAMVAVTAGELSPIVSGIVYCGVILGCQDAYELRRAQEWTAALTKWCEAQPDMVSFTGRCLLHRAEIMQLRGAWPDALEEARLAGDRCRRGNNEMAAGEALYREAEVNRLRGAFGAAEDAYREASRCGWEPQPGLALLRLAEGDDEAAAASIRRALGETTERVKRTRLLPAYVEIMLSVGETAEARDACRELEAIATAYESDMLGAMVAQARGAVELSEEDAPDALVSLRHAWQAWQELEAPYEGARARELVGLACRALGDDDAAALELDAARAVLSELGAAPDLARIDGQAGAVASGDTHGLTRRELEVLRLAASGKSNREIASELVISEHTVARHLQNTFAKLGVSSRTAASSYAYEHDLL